jgi:hypothetical protein
MSNSIHPLHGQQRDIGLGWAKTAPVCTLREISKATSNAGVILILRRLIFRPELEQHETLEAIKEYAASLDYSPLAKFD